MSRKLIFASLVALFVLGTMPLAMAGGNVTTKDYAYSAKNLKIYGDAEITGYSISTSLAQAGLGTEGANDTDTILDPTSEGYAGAQLHARVGFDITLGEKCSAVIELENKIWDNDNAVVQNFLGDMKDPSIDFGFAYIKADEFLMPNLSFTMGIMPLAYDVRNNGNPVLLSTYEYSLSRQMIADMGGWKLTYSSGNNLAVDFLMFNVVETLSDRRDMGLYGVHVDYLFATNTEQTRRYLGVGLLAENTAARGSYYTLGAGLDYYLNPRLELFGELYLQFGELADGVDQSAFLFYGGAKFLFESPTKPYLEASLWYVTGDDGTTTECEAFLNNYEGYRQAIIMENPAIGFDLSTNYLAFKAAGGLTTNGPLNKPLGINAFLGYYTMAEDNGADASDYGIELDLVASWYASDSLAFSFGFGYLTGSDLLEGMTVEEESSGMIWLFDTAVKF